MMKDVAERLMRGEPATFRPAGNSMHPLIKNRQKVTLMPLPEGYLPEKGDIVFAKVRGSYLLHLVSRVTDKGFEISNNKGHVNGVVGIDKILSCHVLLHNEDGTFTAKGR